MAKTAGKYSHTFEMTKQWSTTIPVDQNLEHTCVLSTYWTTWWLMEQHILTDGWYAAASYIFIQHIQLLTGLVVLLVVCGDVSGVLVVQRILWDLE